MTASADARSGIVFLLDADNTLIDNDRIAADLKRYLTREVGPERQEQYWVIFEQLRTELVHKEQELDDVERRYPAEHYVLVDDKIRILTAVKKIWGERVTTVFPRQGHYAHDPKVVTYPHPDMAIERIGDLVDCNLPALLTSGGLDRCTQGGGARAHTSRRRA